MPDVCLELLEAPVPCIMGVQRPLSQGRRLAQTMCTQETLIVLLDSGEVLHCYPQPGYRPLQQMPWLGDMRESIARAYRIFERPPGTRFVPEYFVPEPKAKAVEEIYNRIDVGVSRSILNYLPLLPPRTPNGDVDLGKVKQHLAGHIKPVDEEFVKLFCETQMFATYIDDNDKEKLSRISCSIRK